MTAAMIQVRGARTHNLQNVDVDLPVGRMTVITGLSGSGKSSLLHDTIFAEGQRRYLESVSIQTHQLLRSLPRPDVDEVGGLPPAVSVDQRVHQVPSRSTVAVTAEIYDYLRLLYARCGVVHCTSCDRPVQCQSLDDIVARVQQLPERSKFMLLAPLVRDAAGNHQEVLDRIGRHGLVRVRIDGELFDLSDLPELDESQAHCIDAVVDRLILKAGMESRLRESVALAVRESGDACIVSCLQDGDWVDHSFTTRHRCAHCDISFPEPHPGLFSFNTGRGACRECEGLGVEGVVDDSGDITVFRQRPCRTCDGSRLQKLPSRVRLGSLNIAQLTALSVADAEAVVQDWIQRLKDEEQPAEAAFEIRPESRAAAHRILPDIARRLASLRQVGLPYLTLSRSTRTLSGGEYQRTRLAGCLASDIHGPCYLLDEPTSGLHPQDTSRLLDNLFRLRDGGATLVLVEHDSDIMRAADWLVEIGPAAGAGGGHLLYAGAPAEIPTDTATGRYLQSGGSTQSAAEAADTAASAADDAPCLQIRGASLNNLQEVDVSIPLQQLVCVTGVSGSGKSSLVGQTLLPVASAACRAESAVAAALADVECAAVHGLEQIARVVHVDGRSVSRQRRSCVATHSGVWNDIRRLFARTREARARGIKAPQFSFNSGTGRCSECKGTGCQEVRMNLLPDAEVPCPTCGGTRFRSEILGIRFGGRNVHDVLEMTVDQALNAFSEIASTVRRLQPLQQVGLGYMPLGQPASTYSGGEAQRVRLATELVDSRDEHTLYILDEPTRGLHGADVEQLLHVLRRLIAQGHSVVVIEHNVQVIRTADWVIDMGPGAASDGGRVIACGTPAMLRRDQQSVTGQWL